MVRGRNEGDWAKVFDKAFFYVNKKSNTLSDGLYVLSDRDRIRTCDRLLRRQMLYPAELRDRFLNVGANVLKIIVSERGKTMKLWKHLIHFNPLEYISHP